MTYEVGFAWGGHGLEDASASFDVVIIVDVLSFSSAIDAACSRGARVFPYRWQNAGARSFAEFVGAVLAKDRACSDVGPTLSPCSLSHLAEGSTIVLPSPNGATLAATSRATQTFCGCLRNASAVAKAVDRIGRDTLVVAAGERWSDATLRVAIEDCIGAGAIIDALSGNLCVEAQAAQAVFCGFRNELTQTLLSCVSGKELIHRGYRGDVEYAAQLDCSDTVPALVDGAFESQQGVLGP